MNKEVRLTPDQKRNLVKNTLFTVGNDEHRVGFQVLLDHILMEPQFIFEIVNNGLNVVCPFGFAVTSQDGQKILEYYTATASEGKHEQEVLYKGIATGEVYTFQQCATFQNATAIFDEGQDYYLMSYFSAPANDQCGCKECIAPYTVDESMITFNIPAYMFDKVTCSKGYIAAGTGLPVDMIEECVLFDSEEERDKAFDVFTGNVNKVKVNLFDALRMASSKG